MRQKISDWIACYRWMDWGVLYVRMLLGGGMLLHNIGKMQNYNEIINSYPSLLYIDNTASFVAVTVIEVVLGILLMLGMWVRPSATVLAAGMFWAAYSFGFPAGEVAFLYGAICVSLVITGGGLFAFDADAESRKVKKSNQ